MLDLNCNRGRTNRARVSAEAAAIQFQQMLCNYDLSFTGSIEIELSNIPDFP